MLSALALRPELSLSCRFPMAVGILGSHLVSASHWGGNAIRGLVCGVVMMDGTQHVALSGEVQDTASAAPHPVVEHRGMTMRQLRLTFLSPERLNIGIMLYACSKLFPFHASPHVFGCMCFIPPGLVPPPPAPPFLWAGVWCWWQWVPGDWG